MSRLSVVSQLIVSTLFSLSLSSCSSISKEDCTKDMRLLGHGQGKKGYASLLEEVRKVCLTKDQSVDLEAYQNGYDMGISEFCTPMNGYKIGERGDIYKSFCPIDKEDLFHEKFLIGKKVYEKKDQVIELEDKIKELESSSESGELSVKAELQKNKEELRVLNAEIQRLEQIGNSPIHNN